MKIIGRLVGPIDKYSKMICLQNCVGEVFHDLDLLKYSDLGQKNYRPPSKTEAPPPPGEKW